jgi:hypothetical protein
MIGKYSYVSSLRLNWAQTNEEKRNMFKDGCTPLPIELLSNMHVCLRCTAYEIHAM